MLKLVGVCLVIACFGMLGVAKSTMFVNRLETLRTLEKMLFEIKLMLSFNAPTVSEIMDNLNSSGNYKAMSFLFEMKSLDKLTISDIPLPELSLKDKQIICDTMCNLGSSDLDSQLGMIKFNIDKLIVQSEEARCDKRQKCRLYNSLGFLSGILVSMIII